MLLLWFAVVSGVLLVSARAESFLLLEMLGCNITFDADTLEQFTQCLSAPENIICSLKITGCRKPFILTRWSAEFAAGEAAQLNTTLNYTNHYSCRLLVARDGIHERADAIHCQRLTGVSGYNLPHEHCTPLSAPSNLTNPTEYVTVVLTPSQHFLVRKRFNITTSKEIYGVYIMTNKAFPTSDANTFNLIIVVPLIGFVIVIIIIIIIVLLCWKTKGKESNKKHMGVDRHGSLNCSAILKIYASPQQETTLTPEQTHRRLMSMGREINYTSDLDTANIYSKLHEDGGRREATYDVLQPRQDTGGRRPL